MYVRVHTSSSLDVYISKTYKYIYCYIIQKPNKLYYRYKVTNKCVKIIVWFISAFQILPQHVSAIHCHHQEVVFTSEATQTISVLWMYDYGLQFVQCCQRSRDATKLQSLDSWPHWTNCNPYSYIHNTDIVWVASEVNTTSWWWQWIAETCWGKIWMQSHSSTAGHTGQIVIHEYPQHRYCLSSFWGKHDLLMMAMNCWNMLG
jgi:hypothetical protein